MTFLVNIIKTFQYEQIHSRIEILLNCPFFLVSDLQIYFVMFFFRFGIKCT